MLNPKSEFAGHVSISLFSTLIGELHHNACLFDLVSRVTYAEILTNQKGVVVISIISITNALFSQTQRLFLKNYPQVLNRTAIFQVS